MLEKFYIDTTNYIHKDKVKEKYIRLLIHFCPLIDIIFYPCLLAYLFYMQDERFLKCLCIPALSFLLCTLIRKYINKPRPYEIYDFIPLDKHDKGESFPSRHTLSAFAIGYCTLYISLPLGMITLLFALLVGLSRLIGGLHFPSDILSGFLLASLLALLYFI